MAVALALFPPRHRAVVGAGLAVLAPVIALVRSRSEFATLLGMVLVLSAILGMGSRRASSPAAIRAGAPNRFASGP